MATFRGRLEECVKDYANRVMGNIPYRERVAELFGLNSHTIYSWFDHGAHKPEGINLLKMHLLLRLNGYEIQLPKKVHPTVSQYGELIAMGVLDPEVAMQALSLSSTRNVLRIVSGRCGTTKAKIAEMEATLKDEEFKKAAETAMQVWKQNVVMADAENTKASPAPQQKAEGTKKLVGTISHETALKILAYQVKAMVPLAEWIASNQFTPEERRKLRELSGNGHSNNVFELSTLLNRLCSETARKGM